MYAELKTAKQGDQLGILIPEDGARNWYKVTVTRTTPTMIVVDGVRYNRHTGIETGKPAYKAKHLASLGARLPNGKTVADEIITRIPRKLAVETLLKIEYARIGFLLVKRHLIADARNACQQIAIECNLPSEFRFSWPVTFDEVKEQDVERHYDAEFIFLCAASDVARSCGLILRKEWAQGLGITDQASAQVVADNGKNKRHFINLYPFKEQA